jgi:hypothetical protein
MVAAATARRTGRCATSTSYRAPRGPSRLKGDLYSKHVLYVDSEADFGMYPDQYDRKGQLFINYTS